MSTATAIYPPDRFTCWGIAFDLSDGTPEVDVYRNREAAAGCIDQYGPEARLVRRTFHRFCGGRFDGLGYVYEADGEHLANPGAGLDLPFDPALNFIEFID